MAAQFLGQAVPENPALGAPRQCPGIDVQHPAHPGHIQKNAPKRNRLAFGGQPAAAHRDRHAELLRGLEQRSNLRGTARDHHAMRQPVSRAARIGGKGAARGDVFAQLDAAIAQRGGKWMPVLSVPSGGVGLLAFDAQQGIRADVARADGAGLG